MVWGFISFKSVGNAVFIDGIINQHSYLKIFKHNLKQFAEKMDILNYIRTMIPSTKLTKYGHGCFIIVPKLLNHPMIPIENLWNELHSRVPQKPVSSIIYIWH